MRQYLATNFIRKWSGIAVKHLAVHTEKNLFQPKSDIGMAKKLSQGWSEAHSKLLHTEGQ